MAVPAIRVKAKSMFVAFMSGFGRSGDNLVSIPCSSAQRGPVIDELIRRRGVWGAGPAPNLKGPKSRHRRGERLVGQLDVFSQLAVCSITYPPVNRNFE
jgi:hypothetical protein